MLPPTNRADEMGARAAPDGRMTTEEFLAWAEGRPGRYELIDGRVIAMSPERVRHAEVKFAVCRALRDAIRGAGLPCRAMPDGMTVRIDDHTAFEPDALVYCGGRADPDAVEITNPVIVVEVVSPGTRSVDQGAKLRGYFRVPSIAHYLILYPDNRLVVHHARGTDDAVATRMISEGTLPLDPPGLTISVADLFAQD
ncbi:Uma2 family endonuclease [Methylobacterium sp. J-076]|uniref:Uma2 family endonuclease n=1 Tax=Methylobacterium sp. J-076 TaxID=2836655 RepID=UPI001FBB9DA5|nr:Uma2 family endonuclease [Methylobacterium sp. J-076]MCJ2014249.1 Uma2 family endonuclease [Methylobacterium sp. J-076]